ncbi:hypothetical protein ALC60_02055 [Trachymyrmex zeteki]|uniref:Uncharacterized protein n=1 Tax=Mycetomoellerius zeteki TaxID=64791 RepID=A0A151XEV0_9HYME|nr:hypothetical protein ALC60_02055 [Trachymyrmex zeteki]
MGDARGGEAVQSVAMATYRHWAPFTPHFTYVLSPCTVIRRPDNIAASTGPRGQSVTRCRNSHGFADDDGTAMKTTVEKRSDSDCSPGPRESEKQKSEKEGSGRREGVHEVEPSLQKLRLPPTIAVRRVSNEFGGARIVRRDEWGRIFGDWVPATRLGPGRLFTSANRGVARIQRIRQSLPFTMAFLFVNVRSSASRPCSAYFESMQDPRFLSVAAVVTDKKRQRRKSDFRILIRTTCTNDAVCTTRIIYNLYPEISCQCSNKRTETVSDTSFEQYLTPTISLALVLLTSTSSILPRAFQSKQCNVINIIILFVLGDGTFRTATATYNTRASKLVPDTVERIDQSAANRIPHLTTARGSAGVVGKAAIRRATVWHALLRNEKKGLRNMQKQRGMRHGTSAMGAWPPFVPQRAPTEEEGSLRQRKSMTYRQLPCVVTTMTVSNHGLNWEAKSSRYCGMKGIRERVRSRKETRLLPLSRINASRRKPFRFASVYEMQKGREFSSYSKTLFSIVEGSFNSMSCQVHLEIICFPLDQDSSMKTGLCTYIRALEAGRGWFVTDEGSRRRLGRKSRERENERERKRERGRGRTRENERT